MIRISRELAGQWRPACCVAYAGRCAPAQRRRPSGFQAAGRSQQASVATSAGRGVFDARAPLTGDGRRSLRCHSAASTAAMGMVRALNPGEAMEMAVTRPVLVAPRRVSHAPPRRQPQCTSTKTTRTTVKATVDWSSSTAAVLCVLMCGVCAACVWFVVGVSGHARSRPGEVGNVARQRGGRRACSCPTCRHGLICCCYKCAPYVKVGIQYFFVKFGGGISPLAKSATKLTIPKPVGRGATLYLRRIVRLGTT